MGMHFAQLALGAFWTNDRFGVPVVQMAAQIQISCQTLTDPDSSWNVVRQDSAESSDFDSVQNRLHQLGSRGFGHCVQDEGISDEISSKILN